MSEDRIERIETRVAHQDANLAELSEEVYRQQRELEQLRKTLSSLINRLASIESGQGADPGPADERPPHY